MAGSFLVSVSQVIQDSVAIPNNLEHLQVMQGKGHYSSVTGRAETFSEQTVFLPPVPSDCSKKQNKQTKTVQSLYVLFKNSQFVPSSQS